MAKRMFLMLVVAAALLSALGFFKFKQVQTAVQAAAYTPPPEAVTSVVVKAEQWPSTTGVIGTMEAVHGVMVSADLPGSVAKINFDSGQAVREGDVLVELDTREERAQLAALEAQRDLAKINYGRWESLVKEGVVSRLEYDQATAQQKQTEANVNAIRATIERKTIRAPFSGTLGIRKVNLGQYLSAGNRRGSTAGPESDLCQFRSAAAGAYHGACWSQPAGHVRRPAWKSFHRQGNGPGLSGRRDHSQRSGTGDAGQSPRQVAARHVRSGGSGAGSKS